MGKLADLWWMINICVTSLCSRLVQLLPSRLDGISAVSYAQSNNIHNDNGCGLSGNCRFDWDMTQRPCPFPLHPPTHTSCADPVDKVYFFQERWLRIMTMIQTTPRAKFSGCCRLGSPFVSNSHPLSERLADVFSINFVPKLHTNDPTPLSWTRLTL